MNEHVRYLGCLGLLSEWQADARGISNLVDRIAVALAEKDAALAEAQQKVATVEGTFQDLIGDVEQRDGRIVALEAKLAEAEQERGRARQAELAAIARTVEVAKERDALHLSRLDRLDPRVNVLRLLADEHISVGKACEALNEIAAGMTPTLPQPIDPNRFDDWKTWRERAATLEVDLAAMRGALAEARRERDFHKREEQERNQQALCFERKLDAWRATAREVVDLLIAHHESWERGEDGDALDAPTRALLARPEVQEMKR